METLEWVFSMETQNFTFIVGGKLMRIESSDKLKNNKHGNGVRFFFRLLVCFPHSRERKKGEEISYF